MRRLGIALGFFLALLAGGVVAINWWVHDYLRSSAFRKLVAARTGQALKAEADYQPLQWTGASVFSDAMHAKGEPGTPLEVLNAHQVRARVNWRAIFRGAWRVDQIDVARVEARIRTEHEQAAANPAEAPSRETPPPRKGFLPTRFELGELVVHDTNLAIGEVGQVRHTAVVMRPEGSGWIFDGQGGQLDLWSRRPLDITSFRMRLQQNAVYLTEASLRLGPTGMITASGETGNSETPARARIEWQGVDAGDVLTGEWKKRLAGTLAGTAEILSRAGSDPLVHGSFRLTDGTLHGLPVQKEIAKFTRSPQFERMPLQEVSGDFTHDGAVTSVSNFALESKGLIRVEGECQLTAAGAIDGLFRVGVAPQTLQWLPGSQERVFTLAQGGYLWTTVKVGGTTRQPTEDLSGRLAQAMGEQVIETGVNLLKQAPDNATDAVQKAVDILSPLLP